MRNTNAVTQKTKDGLFVAAFKSIRLAEKLSNVNNSDITKVCLGKRTVAGSYKWTHRTQRLIPKLRKNKILIRDNNGEIVLFLYDNYASRQWLRYTKPMFDVVLGTGWTEENIVVRWVI